MKRNHFIQRINNSLAGLAEWVLDHRMIVITACIILCIGSAALTLKLRMDFNPFHHFPDNDPTFEYYMDFLKEFGNDEFIYLVYKPEKGVFNLDVLRKTKTLVEDLKKIPYVKQINSITNLEFMEGSASGTLRVYKLMDQFPSSQLEADRLKQKLLDKPLYENLYISKDARYAAILCNIKNAPEDDLLYGKKIGKGLMSVLAKPDYKDFKFYPVGNTVFMFTFQNMFEENVILLIAPCFIMITILLILLFRQFKGVIGPFVVVQIALLFVLGFMATADLPITIIFTMIPGAIMAIGIADAVHIISEYQIHLKAGCDNRTSIIKAVKLLGFPCLFTSITTAVGFGSLVTATINPIRDMGLSIAFGTLAAFIVTFTILIVILSFAGAKTEKKYKKAKVIKNHGLMDQALLGIAHLNNRHYKKILIVSVIACIILIYGITRIKVNVGFLNMFGDKIKIFNDSKFVDKKMGGTGNFEVLLDSQKADGIKTLRFVQTLEKIQHFANSRDNLVKKTISIVDMVKDINRAINNNDKSFYKVPSSEGADLQNVNEFIYELYGGEELEKIVSADYRAARLTIHVKSVDVKTYKRFYNVLVSFIESVKPVDYTYTITGMNFIGIEMWRNIIGTLSKSIMLALVIISIMMIFVFRSFKIGLISMVPNMFPVLFGLGFMGLYGINVTHMTSSIGCIVIGLVVDDTIHFMSRYRMEFASIGNYRKALEATMIGVGRALTITTIILVIGFGIMLISRMKCLFDMGLLASTCFSVALLADFFIAPALILVFKPFGQEFASVVEKNEEISHHTNEEPTFIS